MYVLMFEQRSTVRGMILKFWSWRDTVKFLYDLGFLGP